MLLRSTLIYAPAILLTRVSALVLLVVATRLVDQTEYGLLTLVVTVGEMTDAAVTNWLRIALLRLGGKGEISRGSVLLAGRVLLLTTLFALLISVLASVVVVPERWAAFSLAVGAYLIAGSVNRFALTILQMQQRHSTYSLLEFLRAVLQLAMPVLAVLLLHGSFLIVSLGSSLGMLVAGLVAAQAARHRIVAGPSRFAQKEFFALGVPLVIMALVGFGLNNAERLFLKIFYDAGAVAIFAAAYALARQPIDMVANAINMGAFPEVVSKFDEEGPEAAGRFLSHLMALMMRLCLPVAALLIALTEPITTLLLPSNYHGHFALLFPLIAFGVVCANLTSFVYGDVVHAHKRPWLLIIANAVGSVGTISLSLILIPTMAETGAAMALAGGSLASLIACVIISERLTPVPVPWADIGLSIATSVVTGLVARLVSEAMTGAPVALVLVIAGVAGGAVFLVINSLCHPKATLAFAGRLRARLGIA